MRQDILIIGVLFPAIPLMMVNFGNHYRVGDFDPAISMTGGP